MTAEAPKTSTKAAQAVLEALRPVFGERISDGQGIREQHSRDESWHAAALPDAVCFPLETEEVAAAVRACAEHGLPVVPCGVRTSLEGQVIPETGGLSIDFSRMNRILAVRPEDMDATVQPGVTRKQLNTHLRDTGLFFSVDPGADATLGGMASTRASGTNAVRYGTMRENVLSLTAVMADGRVIRAGTRARKSAAGYDLAHLLVGSEGTLGLITELTVKLHGLPEAISSAVVCFDDLAGAVDSVIATIQCGVPIARIELMDPASIGAVNRFSKLEYPEKPTLFLEFHGSEASVREQAEMVQELCSERGGGNFEWAILPEERSRLWQARHDAAYACKQLRPGAEFWATDVCVPISRLAECIAETQADVEASGITAPLLGHVGDGNFHLVILIDRDNPEERAGIDALNERLVRRALSMDGTCTGEHGIGIGKREFMTEEHGEALAVMRSIKACLDPQGILNPGKML